MDGENRAVVFAVHDSTSENTQFSEKAYVVELKLLDKNKGVPSDPRTLDKSNAQKALRQAAPSEMNITDILSVCQHRQNM